MSIFERRDVLRAAAMALFVPPQITGLNAADARRGALRWSLFLTGSIEPAPVYADAGLTTLRSHELSVDPHGRPASVFLDPAFTYRAIATNTVGDVVADIDPYQIPGILADAQFRQPGPNASPRTVEAKLREIVSLTDFGGTGDGTTDNLNALNGALAYLRSQGSNRNRFYQGGQRLRIPQGIYYFSRPIEVKGLSLIIEGEDVGSAGGRGTILKFAADEAGIRVQHHNTVETRTETPAGLSGSGTIIRNVSLISLSGGVGRPDRHGVHMRARATLENVWIEGFSGNGINIQATSGSGGEFEGNSNSWKLLFCSSWLNGKNGLYVDGGDSNAGVAIGCDFSHNYEWGLFDSSFLGNTYVGNHSEMNRGGAWKSDSPNNRSLFLGGYTESGQPSSEIAPPSIVIGGAHGAGLTGGACFLRSDSGGNLINSEGVYAEALGAGNAVGATALGSVIKKLPLYNGDGSAIIGYVPVYDSIR